MAWTRGIAACPVGLTLAALALLSLTLGGCATTVTGQASSVLGAQGSAAKPPPDRDGNAVFTAMRQLDACALLDGPGMAAAGLPGNAKQTPIAPHSCSFTVDRTFNDNVEVIVGDDWSFGAAYQEAPLTIGGAKAYLHDLTLSGHSSCQVDIPVSFAMAVQVRAEPGYQSKTNSCDQAKAAATTVVAKLGNPDAVTVAASRPLANWDGCSLLTKALGDLDPKKVKLDHGDALAPLDGCSAKREDSKDSSTDLGRVDLKYDSDPLTGANRKPQQVGDKTANVYDGGNFCDVSWGLGPSGSPEKLSNTTVVSVQLKDCDSAKALAVKIQQALAGPAPSGGKPQRPLLYRPNEPDNDGVGGCLDFSVHDGNCVPYQPFALPASFNDWFRASDAQPSIGCAIATDAVKEVFGDSYHAVVWGQHCFFVEPTHALTITIDVATVYSPVRYGSDPSLYSNIQTTTVSGKQAKTFNDTVKTAKPGEPAYDEYSVYVSPHNDINQPGMIAGIIKATPARGSSQDAKPDVSRLKDLDQVMTKIIAKYVH
ncbi:DUF3558 family protein [Kutzneria sp. CA-103260]|uniref:DUF3558 family protein n=1 Tax=Kutzneria sp. CA-103260 TaxID=2802641 RepID=UPI001BAC766F|nr:DUF3558 family protein [Kutzneria sp. CA-103260]QUQ67694.1 hypothetical protein JJ691_54290 [Kutzneria sp. CA-103260]